MVENAPEAMVENSGSPTESNEAWPSWDNFRRGDAIFDKLSEIGGFRLFAHISPLMELENESKFQIAYSKIYAVLAEAVGNAGFHRSHQLEVRSSSGHRIQYVYQDDRYDFAVIVQDGSIIIERSGSTFEAFHEWYNRIGPHFWDIISKIVDALTEATGRKIQISRGYFNFSFYIIDLRLGSADRRQVQNYEIMGKLLKGLPDDQGKLSGEDDVLSSASRLDVVISRRLQDDGREWIERYELQAPANRDGERLDCEFSYQGETTGRGPEHARTEFNAKEFIERYDTAYGRFLRDHVVVTFLKDLLHDYTFRSVRSLQ